MDEKTWVVNGGLLMSKCVQIFGAKSDQGMKADTTEVVGIGVSRMDVFFVNIN